jgi:hypothetical protein
MVLITILAIGLLQKKEFDKDDKKYLSRLICWSWDRIPVINVVKVSPLCNPASGGMRCTRISGYGKASENMPKECYFYQVCVEPPHEKK